MESMYLLINDEQLFIDYLFTKQDKKYRDFHSSLIISLSFTSNFLAFQCTSNLLLLADALHSMLELANEEVDFQRGLSL